MKVKIPERVENIDGSAFEYCKNQSKKSGTHESRIFFVFFYSVFFISKKRKSYKSENYIRL